MRSLAVFARRVHSGWWRLASTWVAVAGVVFAAGGPLALPAPAAAAVVPGHTPIRACTTKWGVLVVADFGFWGDPVERGCAPTPTTGYSALHAAGFTTAGDAHDGDAFVCRIDDEPPPNQDGCQSTPLPPDSWSYWHALAGSRTWTYSQYGADDYHPQPGSIDAWVFGNTDPPTFTPAEVRSGTTPPPSTTTTSSSTTTSTSTTTAPPPTTTATTVRAPTQSTGPAAVTTTTTEPARSKPAATRHRRAARPARRASNDRTRPRAARSPTSTTTTSALPASPPTTALRIVNAAAGTTPGQPAGSSPVGLLVGLAAVVVLGGAALATARRRRRA